MANVNTFNYELDKITERETVYDFVSRLKTGRAFENKDLDSGANDNDVSVIFPAGVKLKDEILSNIIRTMDVSDIIHLSKIKTSYKSINTGDTSVTIKIPNGCTLYRIIQEKTGYDVTSCFSKSGSNYVATFSVPATHSDTYKAYYYTA